MTRGQLLVLAAICLTSSVLPLDFSGAAAATPAIARDLGGSPLALTWVVNAFMLSFGSCVMAAGALADRFGRKRVFSFGVALFVVTSIAVSAAPNVVALDLFRVAQGVAAAATLSAGSAALAQEFEGPARARAFSLLGTTFGVGLALGPSLGGALIGAFGWRSVFVPGAVIGAGALAIGVPRMRESRDPDAKGVDWPGTLTFTAALALFTYALLEAPERGWTAPLVVASFVAAGALMALFVLVELRVDRPMLDLRLFRYPRFVGVQALPIATACCYVVLLILLPIRFIGVENRNVVEVGAMMIALSAPMLVVPLAAASSSRWVAPGHLSAAGLTIASIGLFWLGRVPSGGPTTAIVVPMFVIGLGTSLPWGLMDGLSVSVVPKERAGMATGIFSTTRVAGEGIALAGTRASLATFVGARLAKSGVASEHVAEAAARVTAGDLKDTRVDATTLVRCYDGGFGTLCNALAGVTLVAALIVFVFLGRRTNGKEDPESSRERLVC